MTSCLAAWYLALEYSRLHGSRTVLVLSPSVGARLGRGLHLHRCPAGTIDPQYGQKVLMRLITFSDG